MIGRFPTGVSVVTATDEAGRPLGFTASSLTSVSLEPLLLLVCIGKDASAHDVMIGGDSFAVNILGEDAEDLSNRFAMIPPGERFDGVAFRAESTGAPVIQRAAAWLDCRIAQLHDAGDHTIVVGEVVACDADQSAEPLVYHGGAYRSLVPG